MATPKDYITYIDFDGKTCAVLDMYLPRTEQRERLEGEGYKILGIISSRSEVDAVHYADTVLRRNEM